MQFQTSALPDGRLIYANVAWFANIRTIDAKPDLGLIEGEPVAVSSDLMAKFEFGISRDGSKLVYNAFGGQQGKRPRFEVRARELATRDEKTFPMLAGSFVQKPRISPDGSAFSYRDAVDGKLKTFLVTWRDASVRDLGESCAVQGFFGDPRYALVQEDDRRLVRLDTANGERSIVLETENGILAEASLSPDDRWIAFLLKRPSGRVALCIAPLSGRPAPETEWITLFDEDRYLGSPAWSPAGSRLYYLSERDGACSIWVQELDPRTKRQNGETRTVYSGHRSRFMLNFPPGNGFLAAARDKLAFWMGESSGNIYLATPSTAPGRRRSPAWP